MDVSEGSAERFKLGIERFLAGQTLAYHGVVFWKDPKGFLIVSSYSEFSDPANSSPAEAESKIQHSKMILESLAAQSAEFSAVASSLMHTYEFCHDYSTGAYRLAWLENGLLKWRGIE